MADTAEAKTALEKRKMAIKLTIAAWKEITAPCLL
jgi:hypothetical protein